MGRSKALVRFKSVYCSPSNATNKSTQRVPIIIFWLQEILLADVGSLAGTEAKEAAPVGEEGASGEGGSEVNSEAGGYGVMDDVTSASAPVSSVPIAVSDASSSKSEAEVDISETGVVSANGDAPEAKRARLE